MADQTFEDLPKLIRIAPEKPKAESSTLQPTAKNTSFSNNNNNNSPVPRREQPTHVSNEPSQSMNSLQQRSSEVKLREEDVKAINKKIKVEKVPTNLNREKKGLRTLVQDEEDKSKNLISQMIGKITGRNITEQMVPISNETINKLINQIELEKQALIEKAEFVQSQIDHSGSKNSSILKREHDDLEKNIQRYETIKLLYLDKVSLRNENRRLLTTIQELKKENKDLKAKIAQGITQIEAHMHHLPCEREKELSAKLSKCEQELKAQRDMRITLENNISNTVDNFNRLYEEADAARLVIVNQLKEIETKKMSQRKESEQITFQNQTYEQYHEPEPVAVGHKSFINAEEAKGQGSNGYSRDSRSPLSNNYQKKNDISITQRKIAPAQPPAGPRYSDLQTTSQRVKTIQPTSDSYAARGQGMNRAVTPMRQQQQSGGGNLQDMLKRMRSNQANLARRL